MERREALVFGASGYSGLELLRLVTQHPRVVLAGASSDKLAGRPLADAQPFAPRTLSFVPHGQLLGAAREGQLALLATPAKTSLELAPQLLAKGLEVVDLSGAYRLKEPALYPRWYGFEHPDPENLARAAYGLPELAPLPRGVKLVANPGCYATAAILAARPLVAAGLLAPGAPLFMDGKSGTTGAGRTLDEKLLHAEVQESLRPYRLQAHQHTPEIEQAIGATVSFTAHLVPMRRGLLVSVYAAAAGHASAAAVEEAFARAYAKTDFVRWRGDRPPETGAVAYSNFVEVYASFEERTKSLMAFAALDNLCKGAAGQAVQNLNALAGWPLALGLGSPQ